eukprot:9253473-Alexandrium_andersonii.AAC.1
MAQPCIVTTGRESCPECGGALCRVRLSQRRYPRAKCFLIDEPDPRWVCHAPRWCEACARNGPPGADPGAAAAPRRP